PHRETRWTLDARRSARPTSIRPGRRSRARWAVLDGRRAGGLRPDAAGTGRIWRGASLEGRNGRRNDAAAPGSARAACTRLGHANRLLLKPWRELLRPGLRPRRLHGYGAVDRSAA